MSEQYYFVATTVRKFSVFTLFHSLSRKRTSLYKYEVEGVFGGFYPEDISFNMSLSSPTSKSTAVLATAGTSAPPSLLEQVAMAGGAAVITVTFIHPIDVVKVCTAG